MESVVPFKGQIYEDLIGSLKQSGRLFEDPLFPANDKSMYTSQAAPRGIVWRRPREVRRNARFVVDGFGRCDMDQGSIGNCWFIAGVVGIMQSPKLFAQVVPQEQSFDQNYAGIFHFRFWQYGKWVDVCIDDRLPFWSDGRGLVFAQNQDQPDEFWASLLEKAYAKLYGSYEALEAGQTTEALIDMSGGLEEAFDLTKMNSETKATLWTALYQASCKNSIMGCSITAVPGVREARLANGLVRGHAYTITKLVRFDHRGRDTRLVRIRNPWGNEQEWKGAWSDHSREWDLVDPDIKEEIGLVKQRDGEFWMSYEDFLANWHQVQICHLSVNSFSEELSDSNDINSMSWRKLMNDSGSFWKCNIYHSEWRVGKTAGGCGNTNILKFWSNPQFLITLNDVDHYDNENLTTVIIALMQKDSRQKRTSTQSESPEEYIQFKLYKIKDNVSVDHSRGLKFYANQLTKVGSSGSYINSREVTKRFRVEPGHYLIIPSTYDEDRNCEFMVRIFTEDEIEANSLEEDKDDITEEESFFQLDETDELFSSWAALMGEEAPDNEGVEESEEVDSAPPAAPPRPTPKEKCSLM